MMIGVLFVILGECILLGSFSLFCWLLFAILGTHIAFIIYEEPELIRRFGDDYLLYIKHVPRWIPRLKPWMGLSKNTFPNEKKD